MDIDQNSPSWDCLPDVVLTNVFKYLNEKDRFNASLVSRAWSNAFKSPEIWRKMRMGFFQFPAEDSSKSRENKPIKFLQSDVRKYLEEIDINYQLYPKSNKLKKMSFNYLLEFLIVLSRVHIISLKKLGFVQ